MNADEKIAIHKAREYVVVKGNELVQKTRYNLSVPEQKTIAYICSMIKPIDVIDKAKGVPYQLDYEFQIGEYCKICGIDYRSGKNYSDVKVILQKLADRSYWLDEGDSEVLVRWLAKVRTNKKSGLVHIRVDEDLVPYLYDLQERFTSYQLINTLAMKSEYSIRIYELLKSYQFQKTKTFEIDELKKILMVENVKSYANSNLFRTKVIDIAIREINELTDMTVSYETITKGKKVIKIKFRMDEKTALEKLMCNSMAQEKLGVLE